MFVAPRDSRRLAIRIPHSRFSLLQVPELVHDFLYHSLELAHFHLKDGKRLLICDGAAIWVVQR